MNDVLLWTTVITVSVTLAYNIGVLYDDVAHLRDCIKDLRKEKEEKRVV